MFKGWSTSPQNWLTICWKISRHNYFTMVDMFSTDTICIPSLVSNIVSHNLKKSHKECHPEHNNSSWNQGEQLNCYASKVFDSTISISSPFWFGIINEGKLRRTLPTILSYAKSSKQYKIMDPWSHDSATKNNYSFKAQNLHNKKEVTKQVSPTQPKAFNNGHKLQLAKIYSRLLSNSIQAILLYGLQCLGW